MDFSNLSISDNYDVTTEMYTESSIEDETQTIPVSNVDTDWMKSAGNALFSYFPLVFLLFGSVGNCLSFVVMLRKGMRSMSVGIYCAALAVADSLATHGLLLDLIIRSFTGSAVRIDRWLGGRLHLFATYIGAHTSAWLIFALSIDRFICIWFPLKSSFYTTTRNAKIVVGFLVALFGTFDGIHSFVFLKGERNILNNTNELYVGLTPELSEYLNSSWYIIDAVLYYLIPAPAITTLNMLIVYKLAKTYHHRKTMLATGEESSNENNQLEKVNLMLVAVSIVFVMTPMPYYILALYNMFVTSSDLYTSSLMYFLRQLFIALFCLNHSINFYLYCLMGKKFRNELKRLFCYSACFFRKGNSTIQDSSLITQNRLSLSTLQTAQSELSIT